MNYGFKISLDFQIYYIVSTLSLNKFVNFQFTIDVKSLKITCDISVNMFILQLKPFTFIL